MQDDESIYELVAKELATQPRQGLLIKCMAKCDGDENRGKALYIETRVNEIKKQLSTDAKAKAKLEKERLAKIEKEDYQKRKKKQNKAKLEGSLWFLFIIILMVLLAIFVSA